MKLQSLQLLGSVLVVTCSLHQAMGAPTASQGMAPIVVTGRTIGAPQAGEIDGKKRRFTELITLEVRNLQDEKLGSIKDITVDLLHSRLVEVLVSTRSGFLGMNETITPVPPTAFKVDTGREIAYLNVSKSRFDAAPKLTVLNPVVFSQPHRAAVSSRYFGVQPWYSSSGLGYIQRSAELELMQIKNPQGKYLGKVGRIFMDLPTGMVSQIVDDTNSMDGNGKHILPRGSLTYNARHSALVMNASFAQVVAKPHFRFSEGMYGEQEFVEEVATGPNAPAARAKAEVTQARRSRPQVASRKTTIRNIITAARPSQPAGQRATQNITTRDFAAR